MDYRIQGDYVPCNRMEGADPTTWLEQYGDVMYRYAVSRVRDRDAAEDLVQEALLGALKGIDTFRGESSERTWLIGILKHKVIDYLRTSTREVGLDVEMDELITQGAEDFDEHGVRCVQIAEWSAPDQALEQEQFLEALGNCVDDLPDRLRTVFVLREFDGLDSDSLVGSLNISSRGNLWVMLSRARDVIRGCLDRHWFNA